MAWDVSFDPVDADEAIAWFADRLILTRDQIEKLRAGAAQRAFYVSGVAQLDAVTQVWEALDEALKQGTDLDEFKARIGATLEDAWKGTVENPAHRIDTIFRTNLQNAYTAGRYKQATDPDTVADRPYWMFDAILDKATSEICEDCNGTVRPADDPWWRTHLPPLHFSCRSHFITLSKAQAAKEGVTSKPTDADPADGFGGPPDDEPWKASPKDYPAPLWKQFEAAQEEAPKVRTTQYWAADAQGALASVAKDDGKAVRGLLREQLDASGYVSRDIALKRSGADTFITQKAAGRKDLEKLGRNHAFHDWDGRIVMSDDAMKGTIAVVDHFAEKGSAEGIANKDMSSFVTMLHEELHGYSPMVDWRVYKDVGVVFEEAGTEILARKEARDILEDEALLPLPRFVQAPVEGYARYQTYDDPIRTSYNRYIKGLMHGVAEVLGRLDVGPLVEAAFVEIRSNPKARYETPTDEMQAFIDSNALALTEKQKAQIEGIFFSTKLGVFDRYGSLEQTIEEPKKKPKKSALSPDRLPA